MQYVGFFLHFCFYSTNRIMCKRKRDLLIVQFMTGNGSVSGIKLSSGGGRQPSSSAYKVCSTNLWCEQGMCPAAAAPRIRGWNWRLWVEGWWSKCHLQSNMRLLFVVLQPSILILDVMFTTSSTSCADVEALDQCGGYMKYSKSGGPPAELYLAPGLNTRAVHLIRQTTSTATRSRIRRPSSFSGGLIQLSNGLARIEIRIKWRFIYSSNVRILSGIPCQYVSLLPNQTCAWRTSTNEWMP